MLPDRNNFFNTFKHSNLAKMKKTLILCVVLTLAVSGCRLAANTVALGTAVAVGVVGAVGYTVYKGGEAVVSGVGSVGSSAKSFVVSDGALKAESAHTIAELFPAARTVLVEAGFKGVVGKQDALDGVLRAKTAFGEDVLVTFTLLELHLTSVEIKVGDGNLQQSEFLYDQMHAKIGSG